MNTILSPQEQLYAKTFVRDYKSPHARQKPSETWRTFYSAIPDQYIQNHLNQSYWLGTKAPWYPTYFNLDVDKPTPELNDRIEQRLNQFGISESQRLYSTTPSHEKTGNYRIYFRLEYCDRLPTWRLGHDVISRLFGDLAEVYPQKRRKDRLPCGRDQFLITEGVVLKWQTWEDQLHSFLKLDPLDLATLPHQPVLFDPNTDTSPIPASTEVGELLEHGLQQHSTRNHAQFQILSFLWRSNWQPQDAAAFVKRWVRHKHNGFSTEVLKADWKAIHEEVNRQVQAIWARRPLPDSPNNLTAAITRKDLDLAAELYPADVVRQKQFSNLVSYYRPRAHHPSVYISRRIWTEQIAHRTKYQSLISDLEAKGLLKVDRRYRVGEFSRKYNLQLPPASTPIQQDGRNATDFYEALKFTFGDDLRAIADLTKVDRTTLWRNFRQKK
jgi:hypothetical protein